jgi:hypothetical protein
MPYWQGVRYRSDGGSPEQYLDKDGGEAPPEAYEHFARKWMRRFGIKPAGRHKMAAGQTIDELRLDLLESSEISEEQLAEREGIDLESLKKSLRRGRQKRSRTTE